MLTLCSTFCLGQNEFRLPRGLKLLAPVWKGYNLSERALGSTPAYRSSQIFLIGATTFDMIQTGRGMNHPRTLVAQLNYSGTRVPHGYPLSRKIFRGGWDTPVRGTEQRAPRNLGKLRFFGRRLLPFEPCACEARPERQSHCNDIEQLQSKLQSPWRTKLARTRPISLEPAVEQRSPRRLPLEVIASLS
jgi:hypothetical protein